MTKRELREKYKHLRLQLSLETIEEKSLAIANKTLQLPIWHYTWYHLFLPIAKQKEVNTEYLIQILNGKDKAIAVSKTNFEDNTLNHIAFTEETRFQINAWGIPEPIVTPATPLLDPTLLDVVFVPLLAYDVKGNRVGYGKGFYDVFLSNCRKETLKVGLSFFNPEPLISDSYSTDVPLDVVVTPDEVYWF